MFNVSAYMIKIYMLHIARYILDKPIQISHSFRHVINIFTDKYKIFQKPDSYTDILKCLEDLIDNTYHVITVVAQLQQAVRRVDEHGHR